MGKNYTSSTHVTLNLTYIKYCNINNNMTDSDLIFGIMASLNRKEYSVSYLKYLLEPFNVRDSSLRTTLSRMTGKKILFSQKKNKSAYYSFNRKGDFIKKNVSYSFKTPQWENWDKTWWAYIFTIASNEKKLRYQVRSKLVNNRFISLYPGFWIRPYNENEKIDGKIKDISTGEFGHLTKSKFITDLGINQIKQLWHIEKINKDFLESLELINHSRFLLKESTPQEAFILKMNTGNDVINTLFRDPLLPGCYLPDNWAGTELRNEFIQWELEVTSVSKIFYNNEKYLNE